MDIKHITPAYASNTDDNSSVKDRFADILMTIKNFSKKINTSRSRDYSDNGSNSRKFRKFDKPRIDIKQWLRWGAIAVIAAVILVGGARMVNSTSSPDGRSSGDLKIKGAKSTQELNKEFKFPLKDNSNETVSDLIYTIESAELRDEIIVKGSKATAVEGRTFLVITLKITNEYTSSVEINSKDYVRLSRSGNESEWLAPEIHNDPVKVQAISTKYTRLGFTINDSDTDLKLRVGEINGEKEIVDLEL